MGKSNLRNKAENSREIVAFHQYELIKPNKYIGMAFKATQLERQIMYLAMIKLQNNEYTETEDGANVVFKAAEICKEVNNNSGSFYNKLKTSARNMMTTVMGSIDDENETFSFSTLIQDAEYKNGTFNLTFRKKVKNELQSIENDFTPLLKTIVMNFNNDYSFPLYELLRKVCFYPTWYKGERNNIFLFEIGLSQLKFEIGVANANISEVRNILDSSKGTPEDYDRALAKCPDQMFRAWGEFERKCLQPSLGEINDKSDINVTYEPVTGGRGGKVYKIKFIIDFNNSIENKSTESDNTNVAEVINSPITEDEKFDIEMRIKALIEEPIKIADIRAIADKANYDFEKIKKAYDIRKQSRKKIENITGWMITAIQEEFENTQGHAKNSWNDVILTSYEEIDMDQYEKDILAN